MYPTTSSSNNQRLGSVSDDLDARLSLLRQVGDDVICPCKICGGCQKRAPFIPAINVVPYNLDSNHIRSAFFYCVVYEMPFIKERSIRLDFYEVSAIIYM